MGDGDGRRNAWVYGTGRGAQRRYAAYPRCMADYTIDEVTNPSSVDSLDAADFIEMTALDNAIQLEVLGTADLAFEPAELLPFWLDPHHPQLLIAAREGGRMVGIGTLQVEEAEDSPVAWFDVQVLPEFRERGIGGALYERLLRLGDERGKTVLQSAARNRADAAGELLPAPTGFGGVPVDAASTRFLQRRGYRLEQVERISRLPLPVDRATVDGYLDAALTRAGDDYRVVRWSGATPERWLDDLATLNRRMTTDPPMAGVAITEEVWDAARVREIDALDQTSPRIKLTVAVEHVPSGSLAAYNELVVPPERHRPVMQHNTLVLGEHRGRRLGMVAKAANLRHLQEVAPGHPSIITYNAEENRHMLSVNESVGFVAIGYAGIWRCER
jgi:GNAT superfamily N-acetyltransferase